MADPREQSVPLERALLSKIAHQFTTRILSRDTFTGAQAVDVVLDLITDREYPHTTDRDVALRVGRSLGRQEVFVDAEDTECELVDSARRLYRLCRSDGKGRDQEGESVSGVFTSLADCYAPRCSFNIPCYDPACPRWKGRRPESSNSKELGSRAEDGNFSAVFAPLDSSTAVMAPFTTSESEAKRLSAINEIVLTEWSFLHAMEHVAKEWIAPLRTSPVIPQSRRVETVSEIFYNIPDIISLSRDIHKVVYDAQLLPEPSFGEDLLRLLPRFKLFLTYTNHHFFARKILELESNSNPDFTAYIDETARRESSRKLDLSTYLSMPATRLSLYPLLLDAVLESTPEGHPDRRPLLECVRALRRLTGKVKIETQQQMDLFQLKRDLVLPASCYYLDLQLTDPSRRLRFKSGLSTRQQLEGDDVSVYLLDHLLIIAQRDQSGRFLNVRERPIPIDLLQVSTVARSSSIFKRRSGQLLLRSVVAFASGSSSSTSSPGFPSSSNTATPASSPFSNLNSTILDFSRPAPSSGHPLTFAHMGGNRFDVTLWAETALLQKKWVDEIGKQKELRAGRPRIFECLTMDSEEGPPPFKVNCVAVFDDGRRLVLGAPDGVYLTEYTSKGLKYTKKASAKDVTQVEIVNVKPSPLLVYVAEGQICSTPFHKPPNAGYGRIVARKFDFFRTGTQKGDTLLCAVRNSALSGVVYMYRWNSAKSLGPQDPKYAWSCIKQFYVPGAIKNLYLLHRNIVAVTGYKFEIIDPETLKAQAMINPADPDSMDTNSLTAMAVFRVHEEYFVCFRELGFHIGRTGMRSRPDLTISWHGQPTAFAVYFPFILAFEASFVEVRDLNTGTLVQIVEYNDHVTGLRCLCAPVSGPENDVAPPYAPEEEPPTYDANGHSRMPLVGVDPIIIVSEDRIMHLRDTRTLSFA